jgi:transposase-like protein
MKAPEICKTAFDLCREFGIIQAALYNWNKKHRGMNSQEMQRLKQDEYENS